MRWSIFSKLFFSFVVVSLVVFASISVLINSSFQKGLQNYINANELEQVRLLVDKAASLYQANGSWQVVRRQPRLWADLLEQIGEAPPPLSQRPRIKVDTQFSPLSFRVNLLNKNKRNIIGRPENVRQSPNDSELVLLEVEVDGQIVGWVSIRQNTKIAQPLAESFIQHQMQQVYWILAIAALCSFVLALGLVRLWLKPLTKLQQGTTALIDGELEHHIDSTSHDEFDDLVNAFNQLSATLSQQKQLRDQWLSDIAHELRTPLAVLNSEIEAIQDGIRQPLPQYIDSLHQQVANLTQLVADLNALSRANSGHELELTQSVNYSHLLTQIVSQNTPRFGEKTLNLALFQPCSSCIEGLGDVKALTQLFTNLLENSYRYTDANGEVQVHLDHTAESISVVIEDSAPSVPEAALNKLFDRLYRVDKSRSRANGGSGLGLAICQQIVTLHQGKVVAKHSSLGGVAIQLTLPKQPVARNNNQRGRV